MKKETGVENGHKLISIVIPAMNEEENIGFVLDDLFKVINQLCDYNFEVIVVNDHSKDDTAAVALSKNARVINNLRKPGKGNALVTGFEAAHGKYIAMMDADYSHRPEDLPEFIKSIENGAGLVVGSRIYGGSEEYTRVRAFGNIILTLSFGLLHKRYLSDALNGYKLFHNKIFKDFKYVSKDFEIEIELLVNTLRLGMNILEVPSHERRRKAGFSKSKIIRHGIKFLTRIIKEWAMNHINPDYRRNIPYN